MDTAAPRSSLVVLPRKPLGSDPGEVAAVSAATGLSEYDVRQRCRSTRPAVLVRSPDAASLEMRRESLRSLGHAAVVATDKEICREPYPLLARAVSLSGESIDFLDAEHQTIATLGKCQDLLLIVTNHGVKGDSPLAHGLPNRPPTSEELYEETERRLSRVLGTPMDRIFLDVVGDRGKRVRIDAGRFNFISLGDAATSSISRNVRTLIDRILSLAERPLLDVGGGTFRPPFPGALGLQLVDGHDYDKPSDETERAHEIYCRYLLTLWRKGLFAAHLKKGHPAGHPYFLTRSAAAETGEDASTDRASQFALPVSGGDEPDLRTIGSHLTSRTLFWIIASVIGISFLVPASGAIRYGLASLTAGLASLAWGLTLLVRRRKIENVPTSKARSAAAGMCEVIGTAQPSTLLLTPFSRMPCVYYEYRIVSRDSTGTPETSLSSTGGLVSLSFHGPAGSRPVILSRGHSGHIPFRIVDDTGSLDVDPRGATVEITSEQTLYNAPFDSGLVPEGVPVTVFEKYIPVGYPIYVMGELRPADESPPEGGRLSERLEENGRTTRMVIGRPLRSGFFYISEKSEKKIIASMIWRTTACLIAGVTLSLMGYLILSGGRMAR